jgi:hypothetical protein
MGAMRRWVLALALATSLGARADGAFPSAMSVLLPAAFPQRILIGTSFGLVISEDAGATWRYVCEPQVTGSLANVLVYQTASNSEVIAAHQDNLSRSDDLCTWTRATGAMNGLIVVDAFVAPANPDSVLAIGWPPQAGASLFPSSDGGRSFGAPLIRSGVFPLGSDERLLSVEIAASAASVVYATTSALPTASSPGASALLRSDDGGATWSRFALAVEPGVQVRIAQVDPADANTVYLRVTSNTADSIWVTSDGGAHAQALLNTNSTLGGFVRASDGALYAGTTAGDFYVRAPGATGFDRTGGPHLQCLGERSGRIYACGVANMDGYDLAISDDRGRTFLKTLSFAQILGPATCPAVASACAADFAQLQRTLSVPVANCSCGQGSAGIAELLMVFALLTWRRKARG